MGVSMAPGADAEHVDEGVGVLGRQLLGQVRHGALAHAVAESELGEAGDTAAHGRDEDELGLLGLSLQHGLHFLVQPQGPQGVDGHQGDVVGGLQGVALIGVFLHGAGAQRGVEDDAVPLVLHQEVGFLDLLQLALSSLWANRRPGYSAISSSALPAERR